MSDQDLPATEVVETSSDVDLSDLPEFPEEETEQEEQEASTEEATEEPEEKVDETAEESEEAPADDAGEADPEPDLTSIPEEYRPLAQQLAARQVADLQRSYDEKLKDAAETRKAKETVEAFEARFQEDPHGVIAELQELAKSQAPTDEDPEPEHPGDVPDEYADPTEMTKWVRKTEAHREWRHRQELKKLRQDVMAEVAPALETTRQLQAQAQAAKLKEDLEVDDDEFDEIMTEAQKTRGNAAASWSSMKELVRLRKRVAELESGNATTVREKIEGSEERSGLPSTGKRKAPPRSTGDIRKDVDASLKHDGIEFPEGH